MIGEQIFITTVFAAGFLSFFAPCTFPLLPVYIGVITGKADQKKANRGKYRVNLVAIGRTMVFVLGLSTIFLILGFGAGALGKYIYGKAFRIISGSIVIILGLSQMDIFKLDLFKFNKSVRFERSKKHDLLGTYLLGLTFSFAWTPCVGPVLGAIIVVASGGGQAVYGLLLMLVYTLGLAVPFLIMALLSDILLEKFTKIEKHLLTIKRVGGAIIVLMGILLMTQNLNVLTGFFEGLI
ncbi:cytochrome c-type biogenesis protein [Dethiosulfatibacter aminovorans DSM 17477]|uniref:Cytochrome c-type biogenesis protein n=1 Tax=Dethiosulfatibacter aminovorans DSM 17477 TaxID=1121476 RepID=A0A1M6A9B7_9FIRM|nr:cytochrome c biogenesis CcdA family protein [Dethiosulfatibacter aminovorans]SHI33060.1 cytochrome c-type biogenesis protein [Dethiosulfatibacter aminovorans DSM 17477]